MSLQFGILGLLNYAPMTGYNLKKVFDKSVNNIWSASLSQIYRELGTLEKNGFVSSHIEQQDDRPDKKIYCISEEGKKAFQEWLMDFPDTFISPKRDEFMLRIFFGSKLGKDEIKKQLKRFIENRENAIKTIDEDKKTIPELAKALFKEQTDLPDEEALCLRFVVKRAQMTNHLLIQWAEECIKELEE
jgi:PadR family transcriptional regulator, regulatory protein AphA